jgi:hypothetical protein
MNIRVLRHELSCSGQILGLMLVIGILGCQGGQKMVQVTGKIQNKDGSKLQGGLREVRFEPSRDVPQQGLHTASGTIESDGSYHLFTRKPNDGIMPGTYNVMVSVWKGQHEPVSLIDERYSGAATTPFKNVKIDRDQDDLNFNIEPKSNAGTAAETPQAH